MKKINACMCAILIFSFTQCEIIDSDYNVSAEEKIVGDHINHAAVINENIQQPYENFQAIPQGSAQCGPASFYMILNYYADQGLYTQGDCTSAIHLSEYPSIVTKDTAICQYINNGSTMGTSWEQLKDASDGLYKNCSRYYTSELNNRFTEYHDKTSETEREKRFANILENYLHKNRPVIIHLKRYYLFSGHYVVLIGYDNDSDRVYYADPNKGRIGSVAYDDFIKEKWYVSPDNSADWYRARWDGEWMGFFHLNPGEEKPYYIPQDRVLDSVRANKAVIMNADDFGQKF